MELFHKSIVLITVTVCRVNGFIHLPNAAQWIVCVRNLFNYFKLMNCNIISFLFLNRYIERPPTQDCLNNGKRKSLEEETVPMLMHMRQNRHLVLSRGDPLPPALHDIKNIHRAITIPSRNKKTQTRADASVCKKRQTCASVSSDGEQARWLNGLQCARLLFLRSISGSDRNPTSRSECHHQPDRDTRQPIPGRA